MSADRRLAKWQRDFTTRAGYVTARQSTVGAEGTVSTATDTQISGTASIHQRQVPSAAAGKLRHGRWHAVGKLLA
jgi:hypothetical protein